LSVCGVWFLESVLNELGSSAVPAATASTASTAPAVADDAVAARRERDREYARKRRAARAAKAAAASKRGRPKRAAEKAVAEKPVPAAGNGAGEVSPAAVREVAKRLDARSPWRVLAKELGISDLAAQAAHRNASLSAGLNAEAVARFMTL
jgi:hypothetical protein